MQEDKRKAAKKPYEGPMVTRLTREQATLKIMGHAMMGNAEAKELLEVLFEESTRRNQEEKPA